VAGAGNRLRASPAQRCGCGALLLTYMRPTTPFGSRRARERWLNVGRNPLRLSANACSAPYRRCGSIEIEAGRSLPTKIGRRMCD